MSRQLKVGLFVIMGLALTMVAVFLIGSTSQLWVAKAGYRTAFHDVAGLKSGAPVRMGGIDIGQVTGVDVGPDPKDTRVFVSMSIDKKDAARIKIDTVARVSNKGLLGDRMIELTVGNPEAAAQDPNQLIASEEPSDMFSAANRLAAETQQTIKSLQPLAQALGDPKFSSDIKGSAEDIHALLDAVAHGDGTMHHLFFDRRTADRLDQLLTTSNETGTRVNAVLADFQDIGDHLRQGPGIAHALVYDGEISKDTAGTLSELHQDLEAIRKGNGLAHAILYGDDSTQHVMSNLNAISDDMRTIVANVKAGRGTIGALLVDPTVYEDIKSAVGNVERNEVLRALVRYSIKADEQHPSPQVKQP
jgi:phospholipid/cholesterol/gamma-HCH transport system substrate-binding protein